jgi:hypothetical protein
MVKAVGWIPMDSGHLDHKEEVLVVQVVGVQVEVVQVVLEVGVQEGVVQVEVKYLRADLYLLQDYRQLPCSITFIFFIHFSDLHRKSLCIILYFRAML